MKQTTKSRRSVWLLLLLGAVLTAGTLVFPKLGILEWLTMIPLIIGAELLCSDSTTTLRKSYGYGFLTVFSYYFVLYHWFVNLYPLDFVDMDNASSMVVIIAGWVGLSLLQAIPGGLVFLGYRLMHKSKAFCRIPILKPLAFAALWVIFEWSSTLGWTGVPWGRLALGQIELLPMLQISSLLGSYAVSFLLLTVNGLLAYCLLYRTRHMLCIGLSALLLLGNFSVGLFAMHLVEPSTKGDRLTAAVVQGNVDSHEKWSEDSTDLTMEIYSELTRQAVSEGAELVIWPETTFPSALNRRYDLREFVTDLAKECKITLIVGAIYRDSEGEFNSLYMITPDGKISDNHYDKRHLVPFGEYVPMREMIMTLIPPLAELSALGDDLTAGADSALFESEWGKLGSLICFDSIYETLALDSVRDGAGLMLISSNDSWFYDSAAVYQHQAQAQLRAVEGGRFILRAANTGISTILAPDGSVLRWIDPLTEGYAVCEVETRTCRTLYSVIGNVFVYLCIAFCAILPFFGLRKKRR